MASESAGSKADKDQGHRNHFRLLEEEGRSWSGREPNTLFQNRGDGTFDEVGNVLGLYSRFDSRGAAAADLDGDGDLDLIVYNRNNPTVKVFRNDTPGQGNVLAVDLRATAGEPLAAGAQVTARCGDLAVLRQVELGSGFISQGPPTLHFGLGACREVERLDVVWPGRGTQSLTGLPVNHLARVTEGQDEVALEPLRPRNYNRQDLAPVAGSLSATRPELVFERLGAAGQLALADLDDEVVVLNFWATWCTACVLEMPDLERLAGRFAGRVRFLGVAMDEEKGAEEVLAFAAELGTTYEQVWGRPADQQPFSSLGASLPGAIPLTAVIERGTIRAVFVGQIDEAELADLLERLT